MRIYFIAHEKFLAYADLNPGLIKQIFTKQTCFLWASRPRPNSKLKVIEFIPALFKLVKMSAFKNCKLKFSIQFQWASFVICPLQKEWNDNGSVNNEYWCLCKWSLDPKKLSIFHSFYYFSTFSTNFLLTWPFSNAIKVGVGQEKTKQTEDYFLKITN